MSDAPRRLALIAGTGRLPALVAGACADRGLACDAFALDGFPPEGLTAEPFRLEDLGRLLQRLVAGGYDSVCFAGAVRRPKVDPARIEGSGAAALAPILARMGRGDDQLLRAVTTVFESAGLRVLAPDSLVPGLTAAASGPLTDRAPTEDEAADAARAGGILDALGPLDLGQGCIVAGGLCLGVETVQGTAAMLGFVAGNRAGAPARGGVLVKRAKPGQDLRIDLPSIGPETVAQAQAAGLTGLCIQPGRVLILDRPALLAAAEAAGIAVWAA